jgi:hypothetical protein
MRKFLKYSGIILFLWFFKVPVYSQVPLNWTIDEVNPTEDISLFPDESNFTEGAKSCHLQLHSGAVPYLISDIYFITPGAEYAFSMDVFDNDTAGQVKVYADFYDTYGFNIFGEPPVFSNDSAQWQTITWQGSVPEHAVVGYVLVKYYCQPNLYSFTKSSEILVDNVRFRESGGDNLVANGGFEDWVVGIEEEVVNSDKLTIYPNPARDFVNIILQDGFGSIYISDLTGRVLMKQNVVKITSYQLDVSRISQGLYIISVLTEDYQLQSAMLLISRR